MFAANNQQGCRLAAARLMLAFFNGLFFGLIFVFAIGPSFFLLIQNSIAYGFRKGVLIALGISLSDILFVALTLVGFAAFFDNPAHSRPMAIIAAAILMVFGIYSMVRKPVIHDEDAIIKGHSPFRFIFKGFLINIFNPTIALFWITLSSTISINYHETPQQQIFFFAGMLITILTTDILKAYAANRVRAFITVRAIRVFNRLVGGVLVIFALSLLVNTGLH